ncbi:unnamed protein product [Oppiella nova]|uniref:C2H2-type domain-containing protein n=1 Tax=Oppiella nova TaxID=334625 RepID=A0A7R9QPL6_9ACAR|nr:unnamed protein product [Oppiella nova]CAG2170972.1 unnamed protein product [Oppiella nova]
MFVDKLTKLEPHLLRIPFLVDLNGCQYPPDVQFVVPGRELTLDHQNEPYVCFSDNKTLVLGPVFECTDTSATESFFADRVKHLIDILGTHMTRWQMSEILFINYIRILEHKKHIKPFKEFFDLLVKFLVSKVSAEEFCSELNLIIPCPPSYLMVPVLKYCLPFFKPEIINVNSGHSSNSATNASKGDLNDSITYLSNNTITADVFIAKVKELLELEITKEDYSLLLNKTLPKLRHYMIKNMVSLDGISCGPLVAPKSDRKLSCGQQSEHNYSNLRYEESNDKRTLYLRDKTKITGHYKEQGWKVANKQYEESNDKRTLYLRDKTKITVNSIEEVNSVYEELKRKELNEITLFQEFRNETLSLSTQTDDKNLIVGTNGEQNMTEMNAADETGVSDSGARSPSTSSHSQTCGESELKSKKRRILLKFSRQPMAKRLRSKDRDISDSNEPLIVKIKEQGWKVANKQLFRHPGHWLSYDFDTTLETLWRERDAVIQLSLEEVNSVYEEMKRKELNEITLFQEFRNETLSLSTQTDDKNLIVGTNGEQNMTEMNAAYETGVIDSGARSPSHSQTCGESELKSKKRRILLKFSRQPMAKRLRSKDRDISDSNEPLIVKTDLKVIVGNDSSDESQTAFDDQIDSPFSDTTLANPVYNDLDPNIDENTRELDMKSEATEVVVQSCSGSTNTTTTVVRDNQHMDTNSDNLPQNENNVLNSERVGIKRQVVNVCEMQTQTISHEFQCDSQTQTEGLFDVKPGIKQELMADMKVKPELVSTPHTPNQLICVFCRQSIHLKDKKEAFDHYKRHLGAVVRCDVTHCLANFSTVKAFRSHSAEHSQSDENLLNVKNYRLSIDWIHSFLTFQTSPTFRRLCRTRDEFCAVCYAIKLSDTSTQHSNYCSPEDSQPFEEHLKSHLNCDSVFECLECLKKNDDDDERQKYFFGETDARNHLHVWHDFKPMADYSVKDYFNVTTSLSPNLEAFVKKKCLSTSAYSLLVITGFSPVVCKRVNLLQHLFVLNADHNIGFDCPQRAKSGRKETTQ